MDSWRKIAALPHRCDKYVCDKDGNIQPYMMINWPKYAIEHEATDIGARMLALALDEIDRLCQRGVKEHCWSARLLFAYVGTWDRLKRLRLAWLMHKVVPPNQGPMGMGEAFASIGVLNRWREENPDRGEP